MSVRRILPVALATAALLATVQIVPVLAGGFPLSDLAVTKDDSADPVVVGGQITYTITVTNNGPQASAASNLTDSLPADAVFVSATPSQGSCIYTGVLIHTVSCALGVVANGATATVTLIVIAGPPGDYTNGVTVTDPTSGAFDPNGNNNTDTEVTTVVAAPIADLAITKTDSPDPVVSGQQVTYALAAQNNGPDAATNVRVTDLLALSGATFVGATTSQGTCTHVPAGNFVSCPVGAMASGATVTINVTVTAGAPGTSTNTAQIENLAAGSIDPAPTNNSATTQTTVVAPSPTLTPSLTPSPTPIAALLPDTTATGGLDAPVGALVAVILVAGAGLASAWASGRRRASRSG